MHIPDGFLDAKTVSTLGAVSAIGIAVALKNIRKKSGDLPRQSGERHIPMYGVLSAFIFAAQMLNFPVAGGTSGHFVGGALCAILLGPSAGILIMTLVLIVQCFLFQDGGITALGANVFNMGIVGAGLCYYVYILLNKVISNKSVTVFISAWLAVILGASFCAIELAMSGTVPIKVALPAMAGVHTLIGIGEGLITVTVFRFILKVRPDLLEIEKL